MKASIIIASFGNLDWLAENLKAIKCQIKTDDEILVVDDGTPGFDSFIIVWNLKLFLYNSIPGWHKSQNLNWALKNAHNELIICFDHDKIPQSGCINAHRKAHIPGSNLLVVGRADQYDQLGTIQKDLRMVISPSEKFDGSSLVHWTYAWGGNISHRRESALAIGGYDEQFDGCWGHEDIEFALRMMKSGVRAIGCGEAYVLHKWHEKRWCESPMTPKKRCLFKNKHGVLL